METGVWKAVRLEEPADPSVYAIFKKNKNKEYKPDLHGYYHSKLNAISGSYSIDDIGEVIQLCKEIENNKNQ